MKPVRAKPGSTQNLYAITFEIPNSLLRSSFYVGGAYFALVTEEGTVVSSSPFPG